ncbi:chromatin-remodeling ATPase INO80-like [Phoenix dactylifera]|uniref:Chromatin-remodeling ATPase INO80 n=1 Tax=Phoenix dactylifera TaxID=42345 RepID=A0A8B7D2B3_PHODC|nr:chromatin-remodeling ATPase INO80-like [Phoenix dactylifera]
MDPWRHHKNPGNGLSYSKLFDLESLMNFQVPQPEDDFDNYGNSSPDESRSSEGQGAMLDCCNGAITNRSSDLSRRRKRRLVETEAALNSSMPKDADSNDEDDELYESRITEDQYRAMLGEHMQKYRRVRFRDSSSGLASARMAMQGLKHSHSTKVGKFSSEPILSAKEEVALHEIERSLEHYEADFDLDYSGVSRFASSLDSAYLDIGEGITYRIPPTYDKLVTTLNLPSFSDIWVEEHFLKGTLDLRSLAAMVGTDRRFEARNRSWLAEPQPQYESLQARLNALSSGNSNQKFTLQVCDVGLDPFSVPEGAAGRIRRSIMSESGTVQVYYVKVLEKGDTYEIIERSLPKKQIVKKDPSVIEKEELEKIGKVWVNIARRDIPKHHRLFTNFHKKQLADAKRFSETCQREVKLKVSRSLKLMRGAAIRTRKLARDMLIFWKRVDKEQAELRKKEERDAAEALKREEELREARRQQQRLNFLLSQTELYSHFMQNKSTAQPAENLSLAQVESKGPEVGPILGDVKPGEEEDLEEAELKREALRTAQQAVSQQKKITNEFDNECLKLRQAAEANVPADDSSIAGSSNIDLLNPSTMPIKSTVQTPELFKGTLKEYQLKGLQWLVNCYEQGLNGILADEMGLGKTIQAMAFLAHLAEEKNIWGPFLVVAPSSVLNNWADEISRFSPDLKTLPYWGGLQERMVLRKNINPKRLYRREAGFHILITSYQLLVTDEKYLRRVKWQYMVLDEAQAIKSSNSIRWKTLLSFNCRNRLLLTGTPIQNNMAELWALLHFIMPTLFDSHEQFNEWFSKGIENHAEHGGTLNEHQLNRLHAVLKPFMLRRVKKDVITEMTGKTEVTVHCKLSSRQQAFYRAIKNKISLAELFDGSRGHLNEKKIVNLMNIVIQLRKVCNHPELFERNEGSSYFYFADIPNSLLPPPFGELEDIHYAGDWNPIIYKVPKLVHQEIIQNAEMPSSVFGNGIPHESFRRLFNMFSPDIIYQSTVPQYRCSNESCMITGAFGFTRLINLSLAEVSFLANCSVLERLVFSVMRWDRQFIDDLLDLFMYPEGDDLQYNQLGKGTVRAVARMLLLPTKSEASLLRRRLATGPGDDPYEALVTSHQDRFISNIRLLHAVYTFIPRARAPPINAQCPDRSFAYQMVEEWHHPWTKKLFVGFARTSEFNGPRMPINPHHLIEEMPSESHVQPLLELPYSIFGSSPPMRSFDPAKMLTDSGKLQTLDILLKRLRAENHRVLLFAQMTKMLNILEDYMNYRKYKYFRLDGSSGIMDRRDMVRDFQRRNDIFVFLLSTRAGGLGINLTAADTVIFYESDWNPTLDLQAMDRAHRLGQTKEVTVYRLICKETVEEKILQRASQKNTVQQLVMTGGHVQGEILKPEDVVSLLLDDAQLEQKLREIPLQAKDRQKKKRVTKGIRVDAEGDVSLEDFTQDAEYEPENATNKKRKSDSQKKTPKPQNPQKTAKHVDLPAEMDEPSASGYEGQVMQQRPKRLKRPTKSVNENLEPAFNSTASTLTINSSEYRTSSYEFSPGDYRAGIQEGMPLHAHSPTA